MSIFPFKKEERGEIYKVPEKIKVPKFPEVKPEVKKEKEIEKEEIGEVATVTPPPSITVSTPVEEVITPPKVLKSPTLIEIERILSENLDEVYQSLPLPQRESFCRQGEETARQIEKIIVQVKINTKKILSLIKNWLLSLVKIIPGINKLFLLQEAKIKTEKILHLAEKKRENHLIMK